MNLWNFDLLEPCAGKLASTVLRGLGSGDTPRLPGDAPMYGWLGVFAVWFGMAVVVFALRRAARRHADQQAENDLEDKTGEGHAPRAAWRELDAQQGRKGGGHQLQ